MSMTARPPKQGNRAELPNEARLKEIEIRLSDVYDAIDSKKSSAYKLTVGVAFVAFWPASLYGYYLHSIDVFIFSFVAWFVLLFLAYANGHEDQKLHMLININLYKEMVDLQNEIDELKNEGEHVTGAYSL